MRVLLDTDVVLDLLLDRAPFAEAAARLWELNAKGDYEGWISALTPVNVYYIARKLKGAAVARQTVKDLLAAYKVCALDFAALDQALGLPLNDYEDAVQHASAASQQLEAIVTRNIADYRGATIKVYAPSDFIQAVQSA
jgi:predicted nucleic acid-binding protein